MSDIPVQTITREASADLSTKQYLAVKIDSNGRVAVAGAGENAVGVLQNTPGALGRAANVMVLGVTPAIYGGSVTAGQNVSADANGKLITTVGDAAIVGVALKSGSADEIGSVLLVTRTASGANSGFVLAIPIKLKNVADGDVLTTFTPGINGKILKVAFAVTDPVTTANKATSLNLKIGTTNLTGGVVALTSANCTPLGAVIAGTEITANNVFDSADTISIEASSTTAFVEGEGVLLITIQ